MKVSVNYSWHHFNKVPTMFNINDTIELGFSFRRVKVLYVDLSRTNKNDQLDNSKIMHKYFFTLSLLFFKIIVDFNPNRKWGK